MRRGGGEYDRRCSDTPHNRKLGICSQTLIKLKINGYQMWLVKTIPQ